MNPKVFYTDEAIAFMRRNGKYYHSQVLKIISFLFEQFKDKALKINVELLVDPDSCGWEELVIILVTPREVSIDEQISLMDKAWELVDKRFPSDVLNSLIISAEWER